MDIEYLTAPVRSEFPEEWYEIGQPDHFWFRWRLAAMLRQVRDLAIARDRPLRVLDVGGGAGALRSQLESCTSWVIDLADVNAAALQRASGGRGRTLCYDVLSPHPALREAYDVVLLFDVIEHVSQTGPFLCAVVGHLKPGGHLLVNVPACPALFGAYDRAAGHVRRYDRRGLVRELDGTGLEVRDVRYWGLLMVPLLALRNALVRGDLPANESVRRGFQPPARGVAVALRTLSWLELHLASRPPLGTSLLLAGEKRRPPVPAPPPG